MKYLLSSVLMLFAVVASAAELGGSVSMNARYRFSDESNSSSSGQLVFDVVKLNVSHQVGNFKAFASVRNYAESFGGLTIPEAYISYSGRSGTWYLGSTRTPVFEGTWFSNANYSDLTYYLGVQDKFMMGLTWELRKSKWNWSAGFYKNPMTSISWNGDGLEKSRYSSDFNRAITDQGLVGVREENQVFLGVSRLTKHGHIRWYNRIGNISVQDSCKNYEFNSVDYLSVLSLTTNIDRVQLGYAISYYNKDITDKGIQSLCTTGFGSDGFGMSTGTEGFMHAAKVQVKFKHSIRTYAEVSGNFDQGDGTMNTAMGVLGANWTYQGFSPSLELVYGKNHAWVQSQPDAWLINLNLSYYF